MEKGRKKKTERKVEKKKKAFLSIREEITEIQDLS